MRVFVTGASGYVGLAVLAELQSNGHTVLGLARSDEGVARVKAAGAEVLRGTLEELDVLRQAASACEGVIHLAFIHDFSNFPDACAKDAAAITAMCEALSGSDKPFLMTSGCAAKPEGRAATEDDASVTVGMMAMRGKNEAVGLQFASQGVRVGVVRLPPSVHSDRDRGFVPLLVTAASKNGESAYLGDGLNRWPSVHLLDAARVYRLALERGKAGMRHHAVADEGVPFREIAEAVGRGLKLPVVSKTAETAPAHFGFLAAFVGQDIPTGSALTRERLGWAPQQPGLIADLDAGHYFDHSHDSKYG